MTQRIVALLLALAALGAACSSSESTEQLTVPASAAIASEVDEPTPAPEPTVAVATEPASEPTAAPTATPPTEPYDAPGALEVPLPLPPGEPGEIIDTEELTFPGGLGQRILYHSVSSAGNDIAVSGFVAYPDGEAPADGWPLIAWAHGTTGLGDSCAPSRQAEQDALAQALVSFGFAVVATDYEGMGTPGTHPYVVGISEARSVLDSVRAVAELELPVTQQWVAFGHSQGGHAAMFTGQLQASYAPELDMIGVVAGAPPSQMSELNDALIGGDFQGYLVMTAAGLAAADPSLDLADVFSPLALDLIDVVESGCTRDIFAAYNPLDYTDVAVNDDPFALPGWGEAVQANDTNQFPVTVPLLIIHGGEDEQIPVETSATLFDQLCAMPDQGPTVRNVYAGQSHAGVLTSGAAVPDLLAWLRARFTGAAAPDDCPA